MSKRERLYRRWGSGGERRDPLGARHDMSFISFLWTSSRISGNQELHMDVQE